MTTHRKRSAVLENGANDKTVTGTRTPTQITVAPETALAARNGRAASAASRGVGAWPTRRNERASRGMPDVREQSRRLSVSLFMREQSPVRSVGFTSAIAGEGKSLLALTTAAVLAEDSIEPVLLLEANWEHPTLHEHFGLPPTPGLAEWLRGECSEEDVRHEVAENLSVVVAGDGRADAVKLLRRLRERSAAYKVTSSPALLICDLPPVVTCGYGTLAASTMESVVMVVRAGVTPEDMVAQACSQLEHLPIEGVVLNQMSSRIPLWLQRIL
ncbi:MAG TPA: CpsD/CapB family tyrosine-protein kinase [Ktedonobacterales bacterium]|nr:CpsD/CapB family tyrosine-protein kinase [Ktedonobacterales bacterium]